jgi:titin
VAGDKQVSLSWSSLKDDNRKSYLLEYSVNGQTWTKVATLGATATSSVVTSLTNGVSTVFRLTPSGDAGAGVASITSVTPGAPAQAPTALTAQSGDSQVDLSWTAPTDTGGLKINNYIIEESTDGTNWILASSTDGSTTEVNLQGLKNYTNYTFRVSAVTNFGKGLSATLATNASALPSAPLALHIVSFGSQTVTIGWAFPTGASASSVNGFKIEQSIDGTTWTADPQASASALTSTLNGLTNGTTYEIRVTPIAGSGLGASSVILATPGNAPSAATGLAAVSGNGQVTLTFTTPANNGGFSIDNYTVQIANSSNGPWRLQILALPSPELPFLASRTTQLTTSVFMRLTR